VIAEHGGLTAEIDDFGPRVTVDNDAVRSKYDRRLADT